MMMMIIVDVHEAVEKPEKCATA